MNWPAITWLTFTIGFLIAEANTVTLISSWFAVGSLAAMIASLFHAPIWLQLVLFFGISITLLALLRPIFRKYMAPKVVRTNTDALLGAKCYVITAIDNIESVGQVKLNGLEWSARSSTGEPIAVGTLVKVDRIQGVKAYVTPVKETTEINNQ